MAYDLYYWPTIQGRGEFIRLALEEAAQAYLDVARATGKDRGVPALMRFLNARNIDRPPFAPPFLKAGRLVIGQTANILLFLGERHSLAPRDDAGRLFTHQLQLTISDFLVEIHDTHHPIAAGLYYEDQRKEAQRRAADFIQNRLPKFLGYFDRVLGDGRWLAGNRFSYVDLSLFQILSGLQFAFPNATSQVLRRRKALLALMRQVQERPRIAAYLASPRRIAFSNEGIFRHYPELDLP
jgi:glutathione S-transferase